MPDLNDKDVQQAATKIQAAFRGHNTRAKKVKVRKVRKDSSEDLPDLNDKDVQQAATKIQAAFKGHKVRANKSKNKKRKDYEKNTQKVSIR